MFLKRAIAALALTAGLMILMPPAQAEADSGWWSRWSNWRKHRTSWIQKFLQRGEGGDNITPATGSRSVPELDPNAAGSAIVLLVGGVAYIASRRREEDELA